jgi:hypothetical protein
MPAHAAQPSLHAPAVLPSSRDQLAAHYQSEKHTHTHHWAASPMDTSVLSSDAKRRRIDITPALPPALTLRCQNPYLLPLLFASVSFAARRFASLIQDPSVSIRARASATQVMAHSLAAAGSSDCDSDAAASAADWLDHLLNTQTFFSCHPYLILQVSSPDALMLSPPSRARMHAGCAPLSAAAAPAVPPRSRPPPSRRVPLLPPPLQARQVLRPRACPPSSHHSSLDAIVSDWLPSMRCPRSTLRWVQVSASNRLAVSFR